MYCNLSVSVSWIVSQVEATQLPADCNYSRWKLCCHSKQISMPCWSLLSYQKRWKPALYSWEMCYDRPRIMFDVLMTFAWTQRANSTSVISEALQFHTQQHRDSQSIQRGTQTREACVYNLCWGVESAVAHYFIPIITHKRKTHRSCWEDNWNLAAGQLIDIADRSQRDYHCCWCKSFVGSDSWAKSWHTFKL